MARGFNYAPGASAEVLEAQQPGLHKTHIMALAASRNNLVRATIGARDDCPLGLMVSLAHDYNAEVRVAVASNASAQRTVMAYLAADRNVDVLKALLTNPALPADIVEELAFHKKAEVRRIAALRLDSDIDLVTTEPAEDSHTPELAEHVEPAVLQMTADGSVVPAHMPVLEPVNVVDISTRAPIVQAPVTVPQIFTPHSTPDAPAPTRTAPVRGFKPSQ